MTDIPHYRIGNDLTVFWAIHNRDGSPYDLEGKEIHLYVTNDRGREEVRADLSTLADGSTNNVLRWDFEGDAQRVLGTYKLTVEISESGDHREITKDYCEAFVLVSRSDMESEEDDANISVGGDLILSSKLDIYRFEAVPVDVSELKIQIHDHQEQIDDLRERIDDLQEQVDGLGDAGLNEDELRAFLESNGYATEAYVDEKLGKITNFFYMTEDGQSIGTPYNIFSEKEISANGLGVGSGGSGEGGGGGLIHSVLQSDSFGTIVSNDNFTTFNAFAIDSLYKRIKSLETKEVDLSDYYTKTESNERFAQLSDVNGMKDKLDEISTWFTIDTDGNLRTTFNLYSTKEISANGLNGAGGSGTGGGLITSVLRSDRLGSVTSDDATTTFNAYAIDTLYKRLRVLEDKEVDLTGYATESWVLGKGYVTSEALAPYLKSADFNAWKTGSFDPLASQVNTNKNNIATLLEWFKIDGDGNIYTDRNFYSTKEISALGFNGSSGGSGGGLISLVYGTTALGSIASENNNATFNAYAIDSLYKRIVTLENKKVDFTGYATESWVLDKAYITAAALTPYMKSADANDTFATKTALNTLSGSVNTISNNVSGLTTRMATAEAAIISNTSEIGKNTTAITNLTKRVTANEGNIAEILKWFAVDSDGNLYTTYNLYSTKEISANGLSVGSGNSGGGLISQVFGSTALGTITSESNSATFNAYAIDSLYKRIVSLEGKATAVSFVPALTSGKQIGTISIDGVSTTLYGIDAYSKTEADERYLKLSGGEINGYLNIVHKTQSIALGVESQATNYAAIRFTGANGNSAYLVYSGTGDTWEVTNVGWNRTSVLLHSNNYSQYALPLTGGTISGSGSGILTVNRTSGTPLICLQANGTNVGFLGIDTVSRPCFVDPVYYETHYLLHSGNYSQYALPLSGGALLSSTIGCPLYVANTKETWNVIGFKGKSHSDYAYLGLGGDGNFFVTTTGWGAAYGILHSGNYNSYSPKLDGTGASGTWGISITGNAKTLKTSVYPVINANEVSYTDCAVRFLSAIADTSTNLPTSTGYQNGMLVLPLHDNGSTAQMYFSKGDEHFYYRSLHTGAWKTIAFTDSNITGNAATADLARKLETASSAKYAYASDASKYAVFGVPEFATYIDGDVIRFRYGASATIGAIINSSGNVTIGSSDLAGTSANLAVKNILRVNDASMNAILNITNEGGDINYVHLFGSSANSSNTNTRPLVLQKGYGNVGIGINNPSYKLHVDGTGRFSGNVSVGGNVGIGTSEPEHKLHINGNAAAIATDGTPRSFRASNSNGTISLLSSTSRGVYDSTNSRWLIGTNGTNSFLLCGNVGIGTDAPAYKLDVSGTARFTGATTAKNIVISDTSMMAHIAFSRGSANYLYAPSGGTIAFVTNGKSISGANSDLVISDGSVKITGNLVVTGLTTAQSGIKISSGQALVFLDASGVEHKLTYDSTAGAFKFDGNLYAVGEVSGNGLYTN